LQAWYPGWCKRPTFHDEYLPAFNRSNVHLVDTDGQGLEHMTADSITVNGKTYPIDVLVWSTGYGSPLTESLAGKAEMAVIGKDGQDMETLNKTMDLRTLHGCSNLGFPNLFTTPLGQAGVGVNQVQRLEAQSIHIAYIIAEAERRAGDKASGSSTNGASAGCKPVIEPTESACDRWGDEVASAAHLTAAMLQCTPGYFTFEGDAINLPQEAMPKMARAGLYGQGYLKYAKLLDEWRREGQLEGLNVTAAA
jgi:cation diffusion facilitator CzcD-associated flavoprotein CzcO